MTEWILKYINLWELLLFATVFGGLVGGMLGRLIERSNWHHYCLTDKVIPGKYIDFVCRWKPKHAPAPPTAIEELEQQLRNMKTARAIAHMMPPSGPH